MASRKLDDLRVCDRFFIDNGKLVLFAEKKISQKFDESYTTREGVRLSIVDSELFVEKYNFYEWIGFGYNIRGGINQIDNFEPIGKFGAIDVLSYISEHKMHTVFCDWCRGDLS